MNAHDLSDVGRLIQWALRPTVSPAQEQEYADLLGRYLDEPDFRSATLQVATGLGLDIIDSGEFGLLLVPLDDSIFALHPNAFRGKQVDTDVRLLDGLIQVGIAATVYPRPEDLEEEPTLARPPITVAAVDQTIRHVAAKIAEAARTEPDPSISDLERGLMEAWRVYDSRPPEKEGQRQRWYSSTMQQIRTALDIMVAHGLFTRARGTDDTYRPTYAYQMRIRNNATREIMERIDALAADGVQETA